MSFPTANSVIHGDCLHVLPQLAAGSVNFVLTDPPYITGYAPRDGRSVANDDNAAWVKPAFAGMFRALEKDAFCVSFYGWPKADVFVAAFRAAGFRVVGHLAFPKRYSSTTGFLRGQHECAYLLAKGQPKRPACPIGDVINWTYTGNRLHPTQKPVSVLSPLIQAFSRPQGLVLDPFAGSGSTLFAAFTLGRDYLGIELDPKYHAVASDRLKTARNRCASPAPV